MNQIMKIVAIFLHNGIEWQSAPANRQAGADAGACLEWRKGAESCCMQADGNSEGWAGRMTSSEGYHLANCSVVTVVLMV